LSQGDQGDSHSEIKEIFHGEIREVRKISECTLVRVEQLHPCEAADVALLGA
jgi:hypothetical protein